jgi:transposase
MESITKWLSGAVLRSVPRLDLSPISGKSHGKLKLSPEQLLNVIHGRALALWALTISLRFTRPRLKRGPGGRPPSYADCSILLMAVVQTVWRKSYEQIIDHVSSNPSLAQALGFSGRSISQGQYWERRMALGVLPFFFFFLGLLAQLIRLGVVTGQELIVDASLLPAWYSQDPGATWQKYAKKAAVFGYKVHTVLCRQADLPVFILVTPAHMHDSQVGWFVILMAAVIYGFRVLVVYADSAYFDRRMFKVVHDFLHAHPAINYNLRRAGKRKLATPFFLEQWKRLVIYPRTDIERHFAWMKRYFGLKYYQCFTLLRVTQFVFLTYCATLAVALASERYQRPEFHRSRASVLASL